MIVPVTNEAEWASALTVAQAWDPPATKTLVVSPHPDDETLATGGLIASLISKGVDVVVAAVTDGEGAYAEYSDLAGVRRKEQRGALERLGLSAHQIVRLGIPDRYVAGHEPELIELLLPLVDQETHIIAPWPQDFHPDHEACGRAAQEVAVRTGAKLSFYFFWTWHRGTPAMVKGLQLRSFALSQEQLICKTEALLHHHSQLAHPSGEPILPELLLAPARRPFEIFLAP
jgi:LmbE family N-acetylglucosaminyl deacetylase